eukprot:3067525-Rhodomonas_salina.1
MMMTKVTRAWPVVDGCQWPGPRASGCQCPQACPSRCHTESARGLGRRTKPPASRSCTANSTFKLMEGGRPGMPVPVPLQVALPSALEHVDRLECGFLYLISGYRTTPSPSGCNLNHDQGSGRLGGRGVKEGRRASSCELCVKTTLC